ncbi:MAG: hypothetical protein ACI38U_03140 [Corynebacterium sp.]|uniref:hypothetical protein n=1 Tax=Corynebacterium sp. TaxID=1720 RepID=UPI003EFED11C
MIWLPDLAATLPLVAAHPREIEADLQRYYHIDYRDRWRPDSGLTYRRLLVLLDGLPPESLFRSAVAHRSPISRIEDGLIDVWEAFAGKRHPKRNEKPERERREEALEKKREIESQRRAAREQNRRALAALQRRMQQKEV